MGVNGKLGMGDVDACGFADALEFSVAGGCKHERFDDGCFWDFEEGHVELRVNLDVLGLVAACDDVDFVAVFQQLVGEVVDIGACASCERPILGRDEADLGASRVFLPCRISTFSVVRVAPTDQATDLTK